MKFLLCLLVLFPWPAFGQIPDAGDFHYILYDNRDHPVGTYSFTIRKDGSLWRIASQMDIDTRVLLISGSLDRSQFIHSRWKTVSFLSRRIPQGHTFAEHAAAGGSRSARRKQLEDSVDEEWEEQLVFPSQPKLRRGAQPDFPIDPTGIDSATRTTQEDCLAGSADPGDQRSGKPRHSRGIRRISRTGEKTLRHRAKGFGWGCDGQEICQWPDLSISNQRWLCAAEIGPHSFILRNEATIRRGPRSARRVG